MGGDAGAVQLVNNCERFQKVISEAEYAQVSHVAVQHLFFFKNGAARWALESLVCRDKVVWI